MKRSWLGPFAGALTFVAVLAYGTGVLPAQGAPSIGTPVASATLTSLEQARREVIQWQKAYVQLLQQLDACKVELGQTIQQAGPARLQTNAQIISQAEASLKADIEAAHPGYTVDVTTGVLTKKPPEK